MRGRPETRLPSRRVDVVAVGVALLGAYHLALGLFMVVAPGTFFTEVGPFGAQNHHYIRDVATYNLAVGAVALAAVRYRSWRLPVLIFLLLQFAMHTINHLVDIDDAEPESVGVLDFVALAIGTAVIGALLVAAVRDARGGRADRHAPGGPRS